MFRLEVVAIRIDGGAGDQIRRLAQDMGRRFVYSDETHANPSPDGKKIVFASNWCGATTDTLPTSAYVILLPDWDTPSGATFLHGNRPCNAGLPRTHQPKAGELIGLDGRIVKRVALGSTGRFVRDVDAATGAYVLRVRGANGPVVRRVLVPGGN
jgi:hypothetical protein